MDSRKMAVSIPQDVAEQCEKYCRETKQKMPEFLQDTMVESIPMLRNIANLGEVIHKTKNRNTLFASFQKSYVWLPDEAIKEINTYCGFFKLSKLKSYFLYFLIEEKILKALNRWN